MNGVSTSLRLETPEEDDRQLLVARATITNSSGSPIGLFARLRHDDPNRSYIHVASGVLILEKGILELPPGMRAAATHLPYVMLVPPGSSFHEVLRYPVPVQSDHPIRALVLEHSSREPMRAVADQPVSVSRVRFSIGAFVRPAALRLQPVDERHPGVFRMVPPVPSHELLTAEARLPAPITALDYRLQRPDWVR